MTSKRKATQIAVVNLIHCRLSPTRPFSERLPTFELPTFDLPDCPPISALIPLAKASNITRRNAKKNLQRFVLPTSSEILIINLLHRN
ncbi:MAG: hypothetical protein LBK82_00985 [Planctomycetaceae bacterium]|nr:hypothetical protein [Planctomycetaceae bacterium]